MFGVKFAVASVHIFERSVGAFEGTLDEFQGTVPDVASDFFCRERLEAEFGKGIVYGDAQIAERIEQRTVHVENIQRFLFHQGQI